MEGIARHFDGEDALVGGQDATDEGKGLAAEMGGLDSVNVGEKKTRETGVGEKEKTESAADRKNKTEAMIDQKEL